VLLALAHTRMAVARPGEAFMDQVGGAVGRITGTFLSGLSVAEVCSEYPNIRAEAEATSRSYLVANKPVYDRVVAKTLDLARQSGGPQMVNEAKAVLKDMSSNASKMKADAKVVASSESECSKLLANLRKGYWDLNVRNSQDVRFILDN
jgi:hypothetical protein